MVSTFGRHVWGLVICIFGVVPVVLVMASFEQELLATLLKQEEVWLKNIRLTMTITWSMGGEWSFKMNFKGLTVLFLVFICISQSHYFFQWGGGGSPKLLNFCFVFQMLSDLWSLRWSLNFPQLHFKSWSLKPKCLTSHKVTHLPNTTPNEVYLTTHFLAYMQHYITIT